MENIEETNPDITWREWIIRSIVYISIILGFTFLAHNILENPNTNTIAIIASGIGLLSVMAGLSFGLSSALPENDEAKDLFCYCGERLFHAVLLLFIGLVIVYAVGKIQPSMRENYDYGVFTGSMKLLYSSIKILYWTSMGIVIVYSFTDIYLSTKTINSQLSKRRSRYKNWKKLF